MLESRPDLPVIEPIKNGFRLDYGSLKGWRTFKKKSDALRTLIQYADGQIDAHIVYLEELRKLRNRSIKELRNA